MAANSSAAVSTVGTPTAAGRRQARLIAVVGAVLAVLVVWALARLAVGGLRQPGFGGAKPQQLSAAILIAAALTGSLLGWSVMALLEHLTSRPRRFWAAIAPLALLISLAGPLSGHGIIIPVLYRSSRPTETAAQR